MNASAWLPLSAPVTHYEPPTPPELSRVRDVVVNFATTGLNWKRGDRPVGVTVSTLDGELTRFLPFAFRQGGNLDEAVVKRWAQHELRGKRIFNSNTRFDIHHAREWGVDLVEQGNTFRDIGHTAALLDDHRKKFNIDQLAQDYLPGNVAVPRLDESRHADHAAWEAEAREVYTAQLVGRLHAMLNPQIEAEGLRRVHNLEDDIIPVVVELEKNGAPLDMPLLERWEAESRALLERLQWELYRTVGFTVNPDAPTDMSRLFLKCGESVRRTAAGRPSFTADIVQDAATRHPAIALVWRIGKLIDLRNKYLVKYLRDQVNGVLYPRFNQLMTDEGGTVSGRFSCVAPNLQQVMGKDKHSRMYGWLTEYGADDYLIKRLFRPAQGQWLSADAKQIEYRLFAHYSNSPKILARYAENPETDFHNIVRDLVIAARPNITRTEVKTFNFLKIYGGGIGAASRNLGVDEHTAREISDAYDAQFPEAKELLYRAQRLAETRGYVKTLLGRRSRFPNGERSHKALNSVIQPCAADINKLVLREVYVNRKHLELTMRLTVHDSLESDLHNPDTHSEVRALLNTQYLPTKVPVLWDVGTGATWAEAK